MTPYRSLLSRDPAVKKTGLERVHRCKMPNRFYLFFMGVGVGDFWHCTCGRSYVLHRRGPWLEYNWQIYFEDGDEEIISSS